MTPRVAGARGFTIVELIISIAIIAIAVTAVIGVLSDVSVRSAESLVQAQASEIASAYLNEVLIRPFADPDSNPVEPSRDQFDDVGDYNGLADVGARDQYSAPIPGLSQFNVTVQVATPPAGSLLQVPQAAMRIVTVTVVHSSGARTVVSAYRTDYP